MTITGSSSGDEIGFREVVRVDGHCSCDEVAARFISTLGKSFGHETSGEKQHDDKNDGAMCTRSDHGRWWRVSPTVRSSSVTCMMRMHVGEVSSKQVVLSLLNNNVPVVVGVGFIAKGMVPPLLRKILKSAVLHRITKQ